MAHACAMMSLDLLAALAAFALVSSITPGPNNLMLMTSGTHFGFRRTVPHLLGVSGGFVVMTLLIGLGVAGLFTAFPLSFEVLKWVSVAYLLYLAWHIATAPPLSELSDAPELDRKPLTFFQAALFQWVNPKAWTMALTAVTAYAPKTNPLMGLAVIAVVFGAINLPSVSLWTLMGVQLRRFLSKPQAQRAFNIGAALLLVATLYPVVFGRH
jgi:threonine/homoserine/homoserine lactone efflux protein